MRVTTALSLSTLRPVTIRIDADVLAWFRSLGGKYQTRINQVLRGHMLHGSR
ncbi:MAG: BrnA antitoxin family protein [Deltaproteobacteria bacterium]|nr:BrnA antitoxin family protein [Deltaproteobacteria bacterium]